MNEERPIAPECATCLPPHVPRADQDVVRWGDLRAVLEAAAAEAREVLADDLRGRRRPKVPFGYR